MSWEIMLVVFMNFKKKYSNEMHYEHNFDILNLEKIQQLLSTKKTNLLN